MMSRMKSGFVVGGWAQHGAGEREGPDGKEKKGEKGNQSRRRV